MIEQDPIRKTAARRFVTNLSAVLTSDILNKGTTFLIYILVARELSTDAFGQMSLALTLFYAFQVIAAFGMQIMLTRAVANDQENSAKYLVNGLLVGLLTSLAAMLMLTTAVFLLDYPIDTRDVILITALGLLPFAMASVCEAVIRGREKMHLIAFVQVPVNLLKVLATCYLLWNGGTIFQVVGVIVGAQFLIGLALLAVTVRELRPRHSGLIDLSFMRLIVKQSTTFVGIDTVTAWWTSLNIVLLSKLTNETDVGLYNAANQLMVPLAIFYQSVMVAAFPIMCRKFSISGEGLKKVANRLIELLMIVAIPGTVGLIMVATPTLEFVYKKDGFIDAAVVVRITAAILIFKALTFAMGHVLLAGSREVTTLRIVIVDLIVGLLLGWILIGLFGLIGAAVAALLTRIVDFFQHLYPVRSIVANLDLRGVFWHPLLASLAMAFFLYLVSDRNLALNVVSGAIVYFVTLLAFESWSIGGIRKLPARYFS